MGATAAEIVRERQPDLAVARGRVLIEERLRCHDHAVDAVATLRRLRLDERRLDRMGLCDRAEPLERRHRSDRKSTRLNSSHGYISYAVFCLKKKKNHHYCHRVDGCVLSKA